MLSSDEKIEIGKIVGCHGLKGDLKIYPWCDDRSEIIEARELFINGRLENLFDRRVYKNIVLAKIKGADNLELARGYIGKILYIKRSEISLQDGEFLIRDLIGLKVIDNDTGTLYGEIFDVLKTGANDVYAIKNKEGKEVLIPAIKNVICSVSIEQNKMLIKPLEGLFD
jgi:16S rRNA processing protein RimM